MIKWFGSFREYREVVSASNHLSVLLGIAPEVQEECFSWWKAGICLAVIRHTNGKDIEIAINVDAPETNDDKVYYNIYGYTALHKYKHGEFGNG